MKMSGRRKAGRAAICDSWDDEDRRRFADGDRLKARTVPAKRWDGPDVEEWDDEYSAGHVRHMVAARCETRLAATRLFDA
jgi:hypothetical protein